MKFFFLVFFLISSNLHADYLDYIYKDRSPSFNAFGQTGLIQTPSAESMEEGRISLIYSENDMFQTTTLVVSPFDWMEASYFYYRPSDLIWGGKKGKYLDKGFNLKFSYKPNNNYYPSIAIGLDDFAGTGYFSREYLVSTLSRESFKITTGIGWGKYSGEQKYKNPLSNLNSSFSIRGGSDRLDSDRLDDEYQGGTLTSTNWFRGDVGLIGGVEWFIPRLGGLKLKIEHDPFDYFDFSANGRPDALEKIRKKDSNLNYGFSYELNDFLTLNLSYIKGNTYNFHLSFGVKTKKPKKKNKVVHSIDLQGNPGDTFYLDLLKNLNNNKSYLQTASLEPDKLKITVMNDKFRNPLQSSINAAKISSKVLDFYNLSPTKIDITTLNAGIELNKISFRKTDLNKSTNLINVIKDNTKIMPGSNKDFLNNEFRPLVRYPKTFSSFTPQIVTHIGSPKQPIYKGLDLSLSSEVQFSRSLSMLSDIRLAVSNDFDKKVSAPGSSLPHVRTDLVLYLQQADFYIKNLQLDYFWSPRENFFAKISGGILENMYGGIGLEMAYKPFYKNIAISIDAYSVKKRNFDQRFKFLKYKTTTAHINFTHYFKPLNIYTNISYGRYLAKDDGFTFDLSRKTSSGVVAGFFFTRTDVPFILFGEGSFDKGFYFNMPLDIFTKKYNTEKTSFKLRPLTRDGGAKLEISRPISSILLNTNYTEIMEGWDATYN